MFVSPKMESMYPGNGNKSINAFIDYCMDMNKNRHFWKGESPYNHSISKKYCQILV